MKKDLKAAKHNAFDRHTTTRLIAELNWFGVLAALHSLYEGTKQRKLGNI